MSEELKQTFKDPNNWIKTLLSAAITGGSLAILGVYNDPAHVNFFTAEGWQNLWQLFVSGAVLGVVNFWVRSPVQGQK